MRHERRRKIETHNRMHPEHQREQQPGHGLAVFFKRRDFARLQVNCEEQQRKERIYGDAAEIPYQRRARVREVPAGIEEGRDHVEVFDDTQVHQREYGRKDEAHERRKFRNQRGAAVQLDIERQKDCRKERPRMGKANPEDKEADGRAPEGARIGKPGRRALVHRVAKRSQSGQEQQ